MNPGIEKIEYDADGGPITIAGEDLSAEGEAVIEKLIRQTAKGTLDPTGNKQIDHTFIHGGDDVKSDIEADEGNLADLDIYLLGNTGSTPDHTIPDLDLIWSDRMVFDPAAEDEGGGEIRVYRVWNG